MFREILLLPYIIITAIILYFSAAFICGFYSSPEQGNLTRRGGWDTKKDSAREKNINSQARKSDYMKVDRITRIKKWKF